MMILLLQLLVSFSFSGARYHKEQDVRSLLSLANTLQNHSLSQQTQDVFGQVLSNLDSNEINQMRKKFYDLMKDNTDREAYHNTLRRTQHEVLYFYKKAIEKIPGAKLITELRPFSPKKINQVIFRGAKADSLTTNKQAQDFLYLNHEIEFVLDGKVYQINTGLERLTFKMVSTDAERYKKAKSKCFGSSASVPYEERCGEFNLLSIYSFRSGDKYHDVDLRDLSLTMEVDYNHKNKSGNKEIQYDNVKSSFFAASMRRYKDEIPVAVYINDLRQEYMFRAADKEKIEALDKVENPLRSSGTVEVKPAVPYGNK